MSLETETNKVTFQGNASTTVFPYTFIIPDADYVVATFTDGDGVQTVLSTAQYTITGIDDRNGGTVTYPVSGSPMAVGESLMVQRIVPYTQPTVLTNQTNYYPDVVEGADDFIVMQTQQLAEQYNRTIRFPSVDVDPVGELPAKEARIGMFPVFDAAGDVTVSAGTGADIGLRTDLAASGGSALVVFLQAGTGATSRTVQSKERDIVSVKDFGAVGDGVTDDTLAIAAAATALTDGQTLHFHGLTYKVSYQWAAHSDSSANMVGRLKAICYIHNKKRITLDGQGAKITCTDHAIDTYGGFMFSLFEGSPKGTVKGFTFDMSFTGWNNSASYYPMVGGVMTFDVEDQVGNNQDTICSNFTAECLMFKLYHPKGAFAVTSNPYSGDVNNGYKMVTVFCPGDGTTTTSTRMHRNLLIRDITFLEGHNGYGAWAYAYNNAKFINLNAESWTTAEYIVDTNTITPISFIGVVRYHQYGRFGILIDGVSCKSRLWSSRTGAFAGNCGGVVIDSVNQNIYGGGIKVVNCDFTLDAPGTTLTSTYDVGVYIKSGGAIEISNNSFEAWTETGAWAKCIEVDGYTNTSMRANAVISNNICGRNIVGPFVYCDTTNAVGDSSRGVKSLTIDGNIVNGWGAEGAVWLPNTNTYYGVENLTITDNVFDGYLTAITNPTVALSVPGRTSADTITYRNNILKNYTTAISANAATINGQGSFTPNQGAGLTVVGAFSSTGQYSRNGNVITVNGTVSGATSVAVTATGVICSNLPFTQTGVYANGSATNGTLTASITVQVEVASVYACEAIAASATIYFSASYTVAN